MRTIGLSLLIFSLATPAFAQSPSWAFWRSNLDQTCVAELKSGGLRVGLVAHMDGSYSGYVRAHNLPHTTAVTWQVKGQPWQKAEGYFDTPNRAVIMPGINSRLLSELSDGSKLDLYVHGSGARQNAVAMGTSNLSLAGSRKAISQLTTCNTWQTYGVPTTLLYSGTISAQ